MAGQPRRNPYLAAWRLQWRRRVRTSEGVVRALVPLAICALLVPLLQPVFLGFLSYPPDQWGGSLHGLAVRAGLLVVAVLALDVYTALIRSPDRAVLDLHPVDARRVLAFELVRVAFERAWLPVGLAVLLLPIGLYGSWLAWTMACAVVLGAYAVGLTGSAFVHLGAVHAADTPSLAGLLDVARGSNPRAQAAFIYAPGVVLAAGGGLVWVAATGLQWVWTGNGAGYALLCAPFVAAVLAWFPARALAVQGWFRASPILADIDARWAALETHEEGHRVYLDWVVDRLPRDVARYALKDLRHGWRTRRVWVTGPWLVGVVTALVAWSRQPTAPGNATALLVAGVVLCAAIGVLLDRDDPPFLNQWMPPGSGRTRARLLVMALWALAAPLLPAVALFLRHGSDAALTAVAAALCTAAVAVPMAVACGRIAWGLRIYGPLAAVGAAAVAAWTTTWGGA